MYNSASNWNSASDGQFPLDATKTSTTDGFNESSHNCNKSSSSIRDCNVNHYCQNPKYDHITNHWTESMAAMHQQAQQEPNYFRNQWHFNGATTNSYHVNDTTIPAPQLSQNQHCLIIPHTHFHHPPSTGKFIWLSNSSEKRIAKQRNMTHYGISRVQLPYCLNFNW